MNLLDRLAALFGLGILPDPRTPKGLVFFIAIGLAVGFVLYNLGVRL